MCNELLALASGTTTSGNDTTNNEKITDMIVGTTSSSNTVSDTTTDSVDTSDNEKLVDAIVGVNANNDSWSTSTKVLVGLGVTAAVAAVGYGLFKLFSGDDGSTDIDASVEE